MNKFFTAVSLFAVAATIFAAPLTDDAVYKLNALPGDLTARLRPGQDVEFTLEENSTTGYTWAAEYDPRLCVVNLEHKPSRSQNVGASGKVEVDVKALTPAPFTVTLHYARSWEKDKAPLHTLKCTFNQADPAAAATAKKADGKNLPHLKERFYRLANLADAYQVTLRKGRDVDFDLEEQPASGKLWKVTSFDKSKVRLELDHDRADDPGEVDTAEVEIKAIAPGESTVVLVYGDNEKTVTVRVNAR